MEDKYVLDVFKDHSVLKVLNIMTISITILSFAVFYLLELFAAGGGSSALAGFDQLGVFGAVFFVMALLFAIITFHEAIHGLFFKIFAPSGRVRFGYKSGMFYAAAPGEVFSKGRFIIIILMPFIIITTLMLILMMTTSHGAFKYLLALHTGACAGDFYYVYLLMRKNHMKFVEDTEVGMTMYRSHPGGRN